MAYLKSGDGISDTVLDQAAPKVTVPQSSTAAVFKHNSKASLSTTLDRVLPFLLNSFPQIQLPRLAFPAADEHTMVVSFGRQGSGLILPRAVALRSDFFLTRVKSPFSHGMFLSRRFSFHFSQPQCRSMEPNHVY